MTTAMRACPMSRSGGLPSPPGCAGATHGIVRPAMLMASELVLLGCAALRAAAVLSMPAARRELREKPRLLALVAVAVALAAGVLVWSVARAPEILHVVAGGGAFDDLVGAAANLVAVRRGAADRRRLDVAGRGGRFADAVRAGVDDDGALEAGAGGDHLLVGDARRGGDGEGEERERECGAKATHGNLLR